MSPGQHTGLALCTEPMRRENEKRNRQSIGHVATDAQTPARIDDVAPESTNGANADIRPTGRENALHAENRHAGTSHGPHGSSHITTIVPYSTTATATLDTNLLGTRALRDCETGDCDVTGTVGNCEATCDGYSCSFQANHTEDHHMGYNSVGMKMIWVDGN